MNTTDRFLSRREAAEYLTGRGLRTAAQTLARLAATSTSGPAYRIWGSRTVYAAADLDAWAEARVSKVRHCSFETAAA